MVERLAGDAGGQVGDQADAEDLHAGLAGGDRLQGGAHAGQVAADGADHADLGRRLVVGAGELHVDALVERRVDLAAHLAQPAGVEVGQVDEVGALDGGAAGQVDVVADQHRRAGRPGLLQAAAAVGQHDGAAARLGRRTHAVDDRRDALALVEVGAAEEHQQLLVARADAADLAGVTGHRGGGEAGQVGGGDLGGRLAERVDGRQPARAQHQRDVVALDAGLLREGGGGLLGELVRRAAGRGVDRHAPDPNAGTATVSNMLLAVERVALLRRVDMFSHTPGRVLAGMAHVLEEVDFAAGAPLMEAGAIEDWLFVARRG